MTDYTIAVLTPNKDSYSETFIRNHIELLPFKKVVIYGGFLPWRTDADPESGKEQLFWQLMDGLRGNKDARSSTYKRKRLARLLKKYKVDLVLAEFIITGSYVVGVCKDLGIPLIATGLGYEVSVRSVLEKNDKAYREYLNYASASILVAQNMKDVLESKGGDRQKMVWSAAGPSDDFFELDADLSSKNLLAIGRFVSKKAPHLTIMAFAQIAKGHPDARLLLAGDGELLQVCEDLVKGLGVESQVDFIGRIDQERQRQLLCDCRAFVQHSREAPDGDKEGTPVAILEASAAGVPIISTIHSGIPDIVQDGETGILVEEGDIDAMAEAMNRILSDLGSAQEMGKKGRALVESRFTLNQHIDTISEEIIKAIES